MSELYDVLVIGGGINGVGCALDLAGRGAKVLLVEKGDLASATSSASSKLIHGGLRYLEQYAFGLVRESLVERQRLLNNAPHLVKPLAFYMPHMRSMRPQWLLRLGLAFYDLFSLGGSLPRARAIKFESDQNVNPLNLNIKSGFRYFDCQADDSRLVLAIAMKARELGAKILTYSELETATYQDNYWLCQVNGKTVSAKTIVNAAGPWVDTLCHKLDIKTQYGLRLVKGSHIVLPKMYQGNHAYLLQATDNRVVFVTPYAKSYTMIGTTDVAFDGDPSEVKISPTETQYLLNIVNQYFNNRVSEEDIVNTWSGVRSLLDNKKDNPSEVTREYKLEWLTEPGPVLNIYGGKITTYRKLSEKAANIVAKQLGLNDPTWTHKCVLPGSQEHFNKFISVARKRYSWLFDSLCERLLRLYGNKIDELLEGCSSIDSLGHHFGHHLYEVEVRYLVEKEWAKTADDILWRRTKMGLILSKQQQTELADWLELNMAPHVNRRQHQHTQKEH